jgi:sec-independent protein translocase protein TatA
MRGARGVQYVLGYERRETERTARREEYLCMFGLSHLPEILALLVVALLVFGPKRMIEMGSSFGKMFRELREATRDMNWSNMLSGNDEPPKSHRDETLARISDYTKSYTSNPNSSSTASGGLGHTIVEGSVERVEEQSKN